MSAPTTTTTTTTSTSRAPSWKRFSADVALIPLKAGSASIRKRFRSASQPLPFERGPLPSALPRVVAQCPRKSALKKRPSRDMFPRRSSSDSESSDSSSSSPSPPSTILIEFPSSGASEDDEKRSGVVFCNPSPTRARSFSSKVSPHALFHRVRNIRIFTPAPPDMPTLRVFPSLAPPPDLDELSLTVESHPGEAEISPPTARKVRFVLPAPDPEPQWEDPACEFMLLPFQSFVSPLSFDVYPFPFWFYVVYPTKDTDSGMLFAISLESQTSKPLLKI
ncbi:hypothetical protein B0H13DRAFT_1868565 [Mycena leptocephala]|nr:hypothetical protein B0H13DRAFT_1868565 [Mycena leptocephala]